MVLGHISYKNVAKSDGGGEAAMQIGVDGKYIYWTTYGATVYRIDTSEKEQIRIEQIPDGVKMMPIIKCYNTLD